LLSEADYPLPKEFDHAYNESDVVVFEADTDKMDDPALAAKMQELAMYQDSTEISDKIGEETYEQLESELKKHDFPMDAAVKMKPGMINVLLTSFKVADLNMTELGVDMHYHNKAKVDKKHILYLEEIEEQMEILFSMGEGDEDNFIRYCLEEYNESEDEFTGLISDWKNGTLKETEKAVDEMKKEFPEIANDLLDERNKNWMKSIREYLKTDDVEFVLFGNMHLAGTDGIINILYESGYTVEQVKL